MKRLAACLLMVVLTCLPVSLAVAQEDPAPPQMPGRLEASTGTLFEVIDSEYLNVTVQSSEPITLMLESMPEMITMHLEPASGAASTEITLSGLVPSTTYHKYEDDYHNHVAFATDASGSYIYTQDLSKPHLVFIQPRMSTKFIDASYPNGRDCASIGTWDGITKTCTLTIDLTETIQIDSNRVTLDGNGHTVTGTGTGFGVYLPGRTGVTVKNLNVEKFSYGIYLYFSSGNTLANNTVNSNGSGIVLALFSNGNTLTSNNASSNGYGIFLYDYSDGNTLTSNNASSNGYGISLAFSGSNTFTGNTLNSNTLGIYYYPGSFGNKTYNNNFINNLTQAFVTNPYTDVFYLAAPIGGNYWSNWDTPAEGCNNSNGDNFCDAAYVFTGGQDNLPWARQSGWEAPADTTPPVIVSTVTPAANAVGWNNSNVTVTWNVTDAESGIASSSGCANTTVTAETSGTTLTCSATNGAGLSNSASVDVKVDTTAPSVIYLGNAGTYTIDQSVTITCAANDSLSGVASNTCADIKRPAYTFTLGTNSFSASATDQAGNTGTGSTSFTVQVTAAGVGNLVVQFVTKAGVANSMISKLNAAAAAEARGNAQAKAGAIGAFINEIQAQNGKTLTAEQAAILIRLAQAL